MGIYSEYLDRQFNWPALTGERKKQLSRISELRGKRAIISFASALTKDAHVTIEYDDREFLFDQISNLKGDRIDVILETPGGRAEIVEDIVEYIRSRFSEVAMIVPGYAKSAGTLMVMAGDEILMEPTSALGPIDAQVIQAGKRFSAHAFIEGLNKIKKEIEEKGQMNRAYVPILQNISPGEIQNCENLLSFAKKLMTDWLSNYKFKFWENHSSTGKPVTIEEKIKRAEEIAETLCDHSKWLTHGASITISDLRLMRLKITDYTEDKDLWDAIRRYYVLLMMSFDTSNIYKIYETPDSQIYRFAIPPVGAPTPQIPDSVLVPFDCPNCKAKILIQANLKKGVPLQKGAIPFPKENSLICQSCKSNLDLSNIRTQIESQSKRKIV